MASRTLSFVRLFLSRLLTMSSKSHVGSHKGGRIFHLALRKDSPVNGDGRGPIGTVKQISIAYRRPPTQFFVRSRRARLRSFRRVQNMPTPTDWLLEEEGCCGLSIFARFAEVEALSKVRSAPFPITFRRWRVLRGPMSWNACLRPMQIVDFWGRRNKSPEKLYRSTRKIVGATRSLELLNCTRVSLKAASPCCTAREN